jgi:hypothetical protein
VFKPFAASTVQTARTSVAADADGPCNALHRCFVSQTDRRPLIFQVKEKEYRKKKKKTNEPNSKSPNMWKKQKGRRKEKKRRV